MVKSQLYSKQLHHKTCKFNMYFFYVAGSNNDINALNQPNLFNAILQEQALQLCNIWQMKSNACQIRESHSPNDTNQLERISNGLLECSNPDSQIICVLTRASHIYNRAKGDIEKEIKTCYIRQIKKLNDKQGITDHAFLSLFLFFKAQTMHFFSPYYPKFQIK